MSQRSFGSVMTELQQDAYETRLFHPSVFCQSWNNEIIYNINRMYWLCHVLLSLLFPPVLLPFHFSFLSDLLVFIRSVFQTTWSSIRGVCFRLCCRPLRVLPRWQGHRWSGWWLSCHSTLSASQVWSVQTPAESGSPRDGTSCTWLVAALWVSGDQITLEYCSTVQ